MEQARILILEGQAPTRSGLAAGLAGRVGEVVTAASAREALGALRGGTPDMIFLDLSISEQEASLFLHGLEQLSESGLPPVMVLADSEQAAARISGIERGRVLLRPRSSDELADKVKILLEVLRLRRELAARNHELGCLTTRLERVLEMKNRFLDLATHDLRTPVTTIKLVHDIIEKQILPDAGAGLRRLLDILARNVGKIETKIAELLLIAKLDLGDIELQVGNVDMKAIVEDAIAAFFPGAISRGIDLDAVLRVERPLRGDARRIGQLASELIACALERLDSGGKVVVETLEADGGLLIRVTDDGPRLSRETAARMLAGLEHVDPACQTRASLYAAYQIARSHQGELRIEPGQEQGATFAAWLPLDPQVPAVDGGGGRT